MSISFVFYLLDGTNAFRVHVGTLGRCIVCGYTNVHRMQIVKKL